MHQGGSHFKDVRVTGDVFVCFIRRGGRTMWTLYLCDRRQVRVARDFTRTVQRSAAIRKDAKLFHLRERSRFHHHA
jgi:hypothetical protein